MDLLEHLKMSFLNVHFVMIYIIHKILVLIKNNLSYLKMDALSLEEENII